MIPEAILLLYIITITVSLVAFPQMRRESPGDMALMIIFCPAVWLWIAWDRIRNPKT